MGFKERCVYPRLFRNTFRSNKDGEDFVKHTPIAQSDYKASYADRILWARRAIEDRVSEHSANNHPREAHRVTAESKVGSCLIVSLLTNINRSFSFFTSES